MWSMWVYHKVYPNKSYKNGMGCLQSTEVKILAAYHTFVVSYGSTLYPALTAIILAIFLLKKVISSVKTRAKLANIPESNQTSETTLSRKEVKNCITIIGIDVMHFMLYFPTYMAWSFYNLFDVDINLRISLLSLGRLLLSNTIVAHFWNIYIYYFFIKEFREEINGIFCGTKAA